MRKLKVFLINGIVLTATSFLLQTIGLFFNVYISNKIGSESVGVFQLLMSVYTFFITFALSGINLSCMRIISEEIAKGFSGNIKKAMRYCLAYSLLFGGLAGVLLFTFTPFISTNWLHGKVSFTPLYIISFSLPFLALSAALKGYFSAVRRVSKTAFSEIFEQIIQIIIVTYLINLFMPPTVDYACISLVLGATISEVFSFIFIFILYKIDSKQYKMSPKSNSKFVEKLLHISLPIAFTSYVRSGLSTLQQLLIPFRLEKSGISCGTALSQYGQVSGMVMPIIMFPSIFILSFCNLLIPEFSEYNVQNKRIQINYNITKIIKYTLYFSTCIFGIFLCFSKELCTIIYNMPELSMYLVVLSPTIILIYLDKVVDSILKGLDLQVKVMGINILDLLSCLGFIYFLLPVVGIKGYLFVILFSETLNFTLSLRILIKETHFKFDITNIIKPAFSLICSILLIFIFKEFFELHIVNLIILICMFIVFYLLILKFLDRKII